MSEVRVRVSVRVFKRKSREPELVESLTRVTTGGGISTKETDSISESRAAVISETGVGR
jgi:hypothetical protein